MKKYLHEISVTRSGKNGEKIKLILILISNGTNVHEQEGYLDQQVMVSMSDRERQVDRTQICAGSLTRQNSTMEEELILPEGGKKLKKGIRERGNNRYPL